MVIQFKMKSTPLFCKRNLHGFFRIILLLGALFTTAALIPKHAAAQDCAFDTPLPERIINAEHVVYGRVINIVGNNDTSIILRVERILKGAEDMPQVIGIYGFNSAVPCGNRPTLEQTGILFFDGNMDSGYSAAYVNGGDAIAPADDSTVAEVLLIVQQLADAPTPAPGTSAPPDLSQFQGYGIEQSSTVPSWFGVFVVVVGVMAVVVFGRLFFTADGQ